MAIQNFPNEQPVKTEPSKDQTTATIGTARKEISAKASVTWIVVILGFYILFLLFGIVISLFGIASGFFDDSALGIVISLIVSFVVYIAFTARNIYLLVKRVPKAITLLYWYFGTIVVIGSLAWIIAMGLSGESILPDKSVLASAAFLAIILRAKNLQLDFPKALRKLSAFDVVSIIFFVISFIVASATAGLIMFAYGS